MKLYTYYRSQASFRVRIALNPKGIAREDSFLQAVSVAGHPRISRRGISGTAAIAGRPSGAGLGARVRIDQRRRLAPADRAACSALPY